MWLTNLPGIILTRMTIARRSGASLLCGCQEAADWLALLLYPIKMYEVNHLQKFKKQHGHQERGALQHRHPTSSEWVPDRHPGRRSAAPQRLGQGRIGSILSYWDTEAASTTIVPCTDARPLAMAPLPSVADATAPLGEFTVRPLSTLRILSMSVLSAAVDRPASCPAPPFGSSS